MVCFCTQELVERLYSPCPFGSRGLLRHVGISLRRLEKMSRYELDVTREGSSRFKKMSRYELDAKCDGSSCSS